MLSFSPEKASLRSKRFRGVRPIFRVGKTRTENPVPRSFFALKPHGNDCYSG